MQSGAVCAPKPCGGRCQRRPGRAEQGRSQPAKLPEGGRQEWQALGKRAVSCVLCIKNCSCGARGSGSDGPRAACRMTMAQAQTHACIALLMATLRQRIHGSCTSALRTCNNCSLGARRIHQRNSATTNSRSAAAPPSLPRANSGSFADTHKARTARRSPQDECTCAGSIVRACMHAWLAE